MNAKYNKQIKPFIELLAFPFLSWNPSVLTLCSLIAAVLFFIGIFEHMYWLSIVSILGFLFDVIDGYVARRQKKETAFGGFLDSICDRVADFFFITAFGFAHLVSWEIVVLVLFTSFLISYMRSRGDLAFGLGHAPAPGIMQRPARILILLIGFFFFLVFQNPNSLFITFIIIFLLNCITIVQRFISFKTR